LSGASETTPGAMAMAVGRRSETVVMATVTLACLLGLVGRFAPAFVTVASSKETHQSTSMLRGGVFLPLEPIRVNNYEQDSRSASTSPFLLSLVGAALAGAAFSARRRDVNVLMRGRRRYLWRFGGEGPPKPPTWITAPRKEGDTTVSGLKVPTWLTYDRWKIFSAPNRCRGVRWYIHKHNEKGEKLYQWDEVFTIPRAVELIMGMNERAPLRYDPMFEFKIRLKMDNKMPDQQLRTFIPVPQGTGSKVKVALFCPPEEEEEALSLGADIAGKTLQDELEQEKFNFKVLIAKPQMMPALAKLGKILGPRRLMPSPKSGTVVTDLKESIQKWKAGNVIEVRNSRRCEIGGAVGRQSFGKDKLVENFRGILKALVDAKPPGIKQDWFQKVFIGSTLTPSLRIADSELPLLGAKGK
jgi:large subunit ribosomal protein L1